MIPTVKPMGITLSVSRPFGGDARRTASAPLTPAGCRCDRPLVTADDHGDVRCLRCGRATEGWR